MVKALTNPEGFPRIETFRLGASLGMCCGGSVDILIEPLIPQVHALVIGAGHVGLFVAPLLASLGFSVTLCDSRAEAADPARIAALSDAVAGQGLGVRFVHADHDDPEVIERVGSTAHAIAIVMTHDHRIDQEAIEWAIERGFGFIGGVGSRAKAARTRARLEAKGVSPEDVARVRMPIGLDIGARSPAEIGVSIGAELVAWRAARQRDRRLAEGKSAESRPTREAEAPSGAANAEADA